MSLNNRSELFTKCAHARKFYAGRFKRTRVSKLIASNVKQKHNRIITGIIMLPDDCLLHETIGGPKMSGNLVHRKREW